MKKKLVALLTLCMLCLFCAVGFTACSCGGSNDNGTYYRYSNGNYDKSDYVVLDGSTMTDSDGASGKYEIKDGQIYLYVTVFGFQERISGTIKDGVMVIDGKTYCKEGCRPPLNNTNKNTQHTHKFVETVISPTCVQQGYTIYKCSICGYEKTGNYIDVSDNHNYVNNICTVCGKELPPTDGSYFNFTLLTDDTYEIEVKNKNNLPSNILIAPSYYGTKVTRINDSAFENCSNLRSVTIPDSVTSIGENAFSDCSSLTSITIGNSVTSIGNNAFYGCSKLTSITIGNSVTSIGNNAFYGCSKLTSIRIPDSVTSIGSGAFFDCSSLTSITIPDSVTSIDDGAFDGCSSLTSITIPDSVTSIGKYAFYDCSGLTSITVDESNKNYKSIESNLYSKDGTVLIQYAIGKTATEFTIPDSVTSIGRGAFDGCSNLKSITIPNSVTSIDDGAFEDCSNLMSIIIPDSVTSIESWAFAHCSSLTSITIPDSVTSIGDYAFQYCSSLMSIIIPDSVTSIGYQAFYNCNSLTSITIPFIGATLEGTENTHFSYIFGASSYDSYYSYVPSTLKTVIVSGGNSISNYAFYGCSDLTNITIPDSITSIGKDAFESCTNLEYNKYDNGYYLGNATNPYVALMGTVSSVIAKCTIHENTKIISGAFKDCVNIKNITIPDGVKAIGNETFSNCTSLTNITIPDSVTSIGYQAFYSCSNLIDITIGSGVTSIAKETFKMCDSLETVNYTDTIANWQSIDKAEDWNGYYYWTYYTDMWAKQHWYNAPRFIPATVVHCTDGDVDI